MYEATELKAGVEFSKLIWLKMIYIDITLGRPSEKLNNKQMLLEALGNSNGNIMLALLLQEQWVRQSSLCSSLYNFVAYFLAAT